MGLSPDPAKRRNQLANLRKGGDAIARRLDQDPDLRPAELPAPAAVPAPATAPTPEHAPEPAAAGLEVVDYASAPSTPPAPEPRPPGPVDPSPDDGDDRADENADDADDAGPEHRRGPFGQALDGFFGR